jgi:NTP pyrophosphatase (non-canonical NTP hydrolase)
MNIYQKAINKFGTTMQTDVAIEEMSELIKELIKFKRGKENYKEIAEEIADVEIMMEQLRFIYNVYYETEDIKEQKLKRLKYRIEDRELTE